MDPSFIYRNEYMYVCLVPIDFKTTKAILRKFLAQLYHEI